ncbi:uncharacterized protein PFL1_00095 [Pseudozyma flocculosa PF-1]|uniref:Very-long-chain (3R)-3-hydroxyacyl-CoA dehydratase n=1 Tax=Pseudozyma flocculosa TaxID=84751 RepID=A0A5C3ESA4_9BASI|nr:uncharacterized protein PFL1_00095 [Pseudozyma flocculosa PF-1]EPQ31896.1 hypothetical protein PFL1_00095 [Pseudozyma flocculosa PF-1]SPO35193.1 related to PHS1 - essential 3-hydroxyacyl-CoA dehydratase of the ER membrane [Pseudozyma flocculosa]
MPPKTTSRSTPRGPSTAVRFYLIAYNLASFFGWMLILSTLLKHLAGGPMTTSLPIRTASKILSPLRPVRIAYLPSFSHLPKPVATLLERASSSHNHIGALVAFVQTFAILEVVHAALGWVRSPVPTTAIQVASRLFMVWAVSEKYDKAWTSPWYASMVLAWSITECVRYPFYANQLMGSDAAGLLWLRYTTFYVLYPLGAGSEAMCMFVTLPNALPWNKPEAWFLKDYVFSFLFIIWWPGLYVMYTHMIKQRRRAIGKGFWGDKKVQQLVDDKKKQADDAVAQATALAEKKSAEKRR